MENLLRPKKTNPRGIPEAPFIEKVEEYVVSPDQFEQVFQAFQERLQQYKYMMESKNKTFSDLKRRLPGLESNLKMCGVLKGGKSAGDEDEDEEEDEEEENKQIEVNYQLDDTLYTKAVIEKPVDKVALWLGADIMMEYPLDEAIELLHTQIKDCEEKLIEAEQDVEFLRENITTMEVNTARLYNWDVERRQKERLAASK
ncbi:hypothetical protein ACO0RG_000343 [Hanseniaspora osmophila]|uniref:Prefoldin subunit 3 n=1 Tax=Hanseniaspora osmophila TaxID=56408 RepID=A0A1E5R4P0_9ASCO|nr:Prefoldin subunit 3 [Hanseniaspora osmophila]